MNKWPGAPLLGQMHLAGAQNKTLISNTSFEPHFPRDRYCQYWFKTERELRIVNKNSVSGNAYEHWQSRITTLNQKICILNVCLIHHIQGNIIEF